ncbi:MAG TPA: BREX system P-loop protein BrxC, partial [Desulfobacteraceae bacterium]|nr:BREX system P-loop protein BrxC [Desulfobacteraceae bacterium]
MLADIKRTGRNDTDVILFNIDSRADASDGRSAILSVFWNVFNEMLGYCVQHPHIAEFERHLVREGKYEAFCNEFNKLSGAKWSDIRDDYLLMQDEIVGALTKSLNMSQSSAEKWFDKAEKTFSLTIKKFVRRIKEYLDS